MRIPSNGNAKEPAEEKTFRCRSCGCIFNADNTEFRHPDFWMEAHDGITASCECPQCGETVYAYH